MNKVTLQGNLARDLDYKELGGDKCLARGLLAVSRYGKGRDGRDLIRIVLWGKQAVNAVRFLEKGSSVGIIGRIRSEFYEDRDGKNRLDTEVVVEEIQFLSRRSNGSPSAPAAAKARK
jgi:single-strand DNA-binding protein